jgi:phage baseplate assembly protein gpV
VRGYDKLHRLRQRQPLRVHVEMTALDLARELTADLGVAVEAASPGPLWNRLYQHRQSDLELLREACERCGLFFTLRGDALHLLSLEGTGEPLPLEIGRSLVEAHIESNADPACRTVQVAGWDPLRIEPRQGSAARPRSGRRVAAAVEPGQVGGSGERTLSGETAASDRQAEALAQAELDRRAAREVVFWGIAEGDPRLRPGARIEVEGVARPLAGRYVVTAATHTIDAASGFVSEISTAPPEPRERPRGTVAALGMITRVDDPEKLGRVRASLPAYGDLETDWMGVLSPGAGAGKGFVSLPDTGDRVLVLFAREDPGQGVVLGGLYGVGGPPDAGVEEGAVRRYTLLTPGGQRMRFDDHRRTIRLEDSGGSSLEMSPELVRLRSAVDLEIEAPGRRVLIRGEKIDFERG